MGVCDHARGVYEVAVGGEPRLRDALRYRMLTSPLQQLSLCDGHTKPDAGLNESTQTRHGQERTRMSFERPTCGLACR